jgi:hypothetical protein
LARYPSLLRLADSSCRCCWSPPPLNQPALVPKALRSPFGTQLYLRRQRLYYNMRNWIMAVLYLSTTLYIVKMKKHLFLGSTFMIIIRGATVPFKMKIKIFIFFERRLFPRGGSECSVCCLNHPAINTWSLEQKSPRRNVRRKSNCTVQNGICYIKEAICIEHQTKLKELRNNICGDFDIYQ